MEAGTPFFFVKTFAARSFKHALSFVTLGLDPRVHAAPGAWMVGSGPTVTEERWRCLGGSAAGSSLLSGLRISPNEKGRALRAALSCLCVLSYSAKKAKRTERAAVRIL